MKSMMMISFNSIAIEPKWNLYLDGHEFCYGQREPFKIGSLSSSLANTLSDIRQR